MNPETQESHRISIIKSIKHRIRSLMRRSGHDIVRFDPRYEVASHPDASALPPGTAEQLRSDHPRLRELRERYAKLDLPIALRSHWGPGYLKKELDLTHFRGDNAYVWQFRYVGSAARQKYYLFLRDLAGRDTYGLLNRLKEDGLFGCWTFEFPGWPTVSRDLLDSMNELYFLDRHTGILQRPGFTVLDIGAGYGRLAHRTLAAAPQLGAFLCADAVPESTFLCEFYTRFRECGPRAQVFPLHEFDVGLQGRKIDLALSVHSFSEMSGRAIDGWVGRAAKHHIPWLFIVPNDADRLLTTEDDRSRHEFDSLLAGHGYELVIKQPIFADPAMQESMGVTDHFHLFRHRSAKA